MPTTMNRVKRTNKEEKKEILPKVITKLSLIHPYRSAEF